MKIIDNIKKMSKKHKENKAKKDAVKKEKAKEVAIKREKDRIDRIKEQLKSAKSDAKKVGATVDQILMLRILEKTKDIETSVDSVRGSIFLNSN